MKKFILLTSLCGSLLFAGVCTVSAVKIVVKGEEDREVEYDNVGDMTRIEDIRQFLFRELKLKYGQVLVFEINGRKIPDEEFGELVYLSEDSPITAEVKFRYAVDVRRRSGKQHFDLLLDNNKTVEDLIAETLKTGGLASDEEVTPFMAPSYTCDQKEQQVDGQAFLEVLKCRYFILQVKEVLPPVPNILVKVESEEEPREFRDDLSFGKIIFLLHAELRTVLSDSRRILKIYDATGKGVDYSKAGKDYPQGSHFTAMLMYKYGRVEVYRNQERIGFPLILDKPDATTLDLITEARNSGLVKTDEEASLWNATPNARCGEEIVGSQSLGDSDCTNFLLLAKETPPTEEAALLIRYSVQRGTETPWARCYFDLPVDARGSELIVEVREKFSPNLPLPERKFVLKDSKGKVISEESLLICFRDYNPFVLETPAEASGLPKLKFRPLKPPITINIAIEGKIGAKTFESNLYFHEIRASLIEKFCGGHINMERRQLVIQVDGQEVDYRKKGEDYAPECQFIADIWHPNFFVMFEKGKECGTYSLVLPKEATASVLVAKVREKRSEESPNEEYTLFASKNSPERVKLINFSDETSFQKIPEQENLKALLDQGFIFLALEIRKVFFLSVPGKSLRLSTPVLTSPITINVVVEGKIGARTFGSNLIFQGIRKSLIEELDVSQSSLGQIIIQADGHEVDYGKKGEDYAPGCHFTADIVYPYDVVLFREGKRLAKYTFVLPKEATAITLVAKTQEKRRRKSPNEEYTPFASKNSPKRGEIINFSDGTFFRQISAQQNLKILVGDGFSFLALEIKKVFSELALPRPALPLPKPVLSEPALPKPVLSELALAKPALSEPALPKPVLSEPALPKPALPEPALSKPALPKPALPKPALPFGPGGSSYCSYHIRVYRNSIERGFYNLPFSENATTDHIVSCIHEIQKKMNKSISIEETIIIVCFGSKDQQIVKIKRIIKPRNLKILKTSLKAVEFRVYLIEVGFASTFVSFKPLFVPPPAKDPLLPKYNVRVYTNRAEILFYPVSLPTGATVGDLVNGVKEQVTLAPDEELVISDSRNSNKQPNIQKKLGRSDLYYLVFEIKKVALTPTDAPPPPSLKDCPSSQRPFSDANSVEPVMKDTSVPLVPVPRSLPISDVVTINIKGTSVFGSSEKFGSRLVSALTFADAMTFFEIRDTLATLSGKTDLGIFSDVDGKEVEYHRTGKDLSPGYRVFTAVLARWYKVEVDQCFRRTRTEIQLFGNPLARHLLDEVRRKFGWGGWPDFILRLFYLNLEGQEELLDDDETLTYPPPGRDDGKMSAYNSHRVRVGLKAKEIPCMSPSKSTDVTLLPDIISHPSQQCSVILPLARSFASRTEYTLRARIGIKFDNIVVYEEELLIKSGYLPREATVGDLFVYTKRELSRTVAPVPPGLKLVLKAQGHVFGEEEFMEEIMNGRKVDDFSIEALYCLQ